LVALTDQAAKPRRSNGCSRPRAKPTSSRACRRRAHRGRPRPGLERPTRVHLPCDGRAQRGMRGIDGSGSAGGASVTDSRNAARMRQFSPSQQPSGMTCTTPSSATDSSAIAGSPCSAQQRSDKRSRSSCSTVCANRGAGWLDRIGARTLEYSPESGPHSSGAGQGIVLCSVKRVSMVPPVWQEPSAAANATDTRGVGACQ
jgi:hypothetical protein